MPEVLEMCVHSVPARNQSIGWPQIHSFIEGNTMKVLCVPLCCGFACVRKQHAKCQTVISDIESDRSAIVRWSAGIERLVVPSWQRTGHFAPSADDGGPVSL